MKNDKVKEDLQERVIDFAVDIIRLVEMLPNTKEAVDIGKEVLRSGTSPAFNYGEAQSSDLKRYFIRKIKMCSRDLRKTRVGLEEVSRLNLKNPHSEAERLHEECQELDSIFEKLIEKQNEE